VQTEQTLRTCLAILRSHANRTALGVFYGLDWIATVPPTVALARQAFGAEKAGLVFGWIMAAHQVGAALAASIAGLIRTNEGNYDHAFMIAGLLLFAGRRPQGRVLSPQGV
jgi:predicted MFS family arabinose efflux permease